MKYYLTVFSPLQCFHQDTEEMAPETKKANCATFDSENTSELTVHSHWAGVWNVSLQNVFCP